MTYGRFAAVDLGATSGRVCVVTLDGDALTVEEVGRFPNGPQRRGDGWHWDVATLYRHVVDVLRREHEREALTSVGVDSWAVDYGWLLETGELRDEPFCYRDDRTGAVVDDFAQQGQLPTLFARTGIAHQPFNTIFQLATDMRQQRQGARAALIPDLFNYWLTGQLVSEITNASTTQLLLPNGLWDEELFARIGLSPAIFGPLVESGHVLGLATGIDVPLPVINVASHDTASAVVAVPAVNPHFAYISCGTWSLVGVERSSVVLSEEARRAGFSNERGVEGTVRLLRNVMGLWVLSECVRHWNATGTAISTEDLTKQAAGEQADRTLVDIDDQSLFAPGDMPARFLDVCARSGQPLPQSPAQMARAIIDSLAAAYARTIIELENLTQSPIEVIHLVGGGVHNTLLCQVTATKTGRTVVAGPVEAAALGNALVQAQAMRVINGDRWALRKFLSKKCELVRYEPLRPSA